MSFEALKNETEKPNAFFAATESLKDKDGVPLKREIRALTTKDTEKIRNKCTIDVPVPGKPGMYRQKITDKYVPSIIAAAVISPDLNDADLQDSYGVTTPEDLVVEMIDNPNEYAKTLQFIQNYSGMDGTLDDEIETAKN